MFSRGLGLALVSGLILTGCTAPGSDPGTGAQQSAGVGVSGAAVFSASDARNLSKLPARQGKELKVARLRAGLVPPTNRWFSGLVFGDKANPVFPHPLSFGLEEDAFTFGMPTINTTPKAIMGGNAPHLRVKVNGVQKWEVSAYDELSVTTAAVGAGGDLGTVTIAQGSPFVRYSSAADTTVSMNLPFRPEGNYFKVQAGEYAYGLVLENGILSDTEVKLGPRGSLTWFPIPNDGDGAKLAELAAHPLQQTSVDYRVEGGEASTTLRYNPAGGDTAYARLPHQPGGDACDLGTFGSIYGTMRLCRGSELTWRTPTYPARAGLDLSRLTDAEKKEVAEAVRRDVRSAKPYPGDTYFGGKALYRDAMLWTIAKQVGPDDVTDSLKKRVTEELLKWGELDGCKKRQARCFAYDKTNRGVMGYSANFGSDEYNDHHFHYGYFLYAAGILGADDPELVKRIKPVMDALAQDIATSPASEQLPQRRNFDAYKGHSWASGTSPFADGNNQESSSEAVNAWAGLSLWAQVSGNPNLQAEATWMHALEAGSARAYWTDFDPTDKVYQGYQHSIVPLNWGGKRDYATWFSAEPAAAMAILVIPASPSSDHLAGDPERIRRNVAEATATNGFQQQYGDYLLMYSALAGEPERQAALAEARKMQLSLIDDGNSQSYFLAWLLSLRK